MKRKKVGDLMHSENEVVYLYLDDIIPNRFQPRELFDERSLKELAVSIKEHGVIQPIIVRKNGEKYEIIAGERRYKASAKAGLTKIPAIIRNLDDKESSKVALLENLQRKNLNPIEEAKTYQKILEIDQMTQEELAKTMGKSQSAVANKLRLLSLSDAVQNALLEAKISERHARTLLAVHDKEEQEKLVKKVIQERITVRELERLIKHGQDMQNEMNMEVPKEEIKTEDDNTDFKFDSFDNIPQTEDSHHVPDTMINFDDVNKELNNETVEERDGAAFNPQLGGTENVGNRKINDDLSFDTLEKPSLIDYGEEDSGTDEDGSSQKNIDFTSPKVDENNFFDDEFIKGNVPQQDNDSSVTSLDSLLNIHPAKEEKVRDVSKDNDDFDITDETDDLNDDSFEDDSDDYDNMKIPDNNSNKKEPDIMNFDETLFKTPTIEDFEIKNKANMMNSSAINASTYRNALREDAYPEIKEEQEKNKQKKPMNSDVQSGINAIRDTVRRLENENLKIDTDEMNFENSYQIVIKIQKFPNDEEK